MYYSTAIAYDDVKRSVTSTDAAGNVTAISYDALKRPITKTVGTGQPTSLTYDSTTAANSIGALASVDMADGTSYAYAYDVYGNAVTAVITMAGSSYTFSKTCTPTQKVKQLTYPDGSSVVNAYNAGNQLTAVSPVAPASGVPASFAVFDEFDCFGHPQSVTFGNGVQDTSAYNGGGLMKSQAIAAPDGSAIASSAFSWDALGNISETADLVDSAKTRTFNYDPVGRLTDVTGDFSTPQHFEYDQGGNVTLKDGISYSSDGYRVTTGTQNEAQVFSAVPTPPATCTPRRAPGRQSNMRMMANAG